MAVKHTVGGLAGAIGMTLGAVIGYTQAQAVDINPYQGALIFGLFGLIIGGVASLFLRTLPAMIIYFIIAGLVIYGFQNSIEAMTGMNPVDSIEDITENIEKLGKTVDKFFKDLDFQ